MKRSESIKSISPAILEVQRSLKPAARSQDNPFFKSSYTDLAGVWDNCRGLLGKAGLIVVQTIDEHYRLAGVSDTSGRGPYLITTLIHAPTGEWIESILKISAKDYDNPQSVGSAITYARRYSMAAILGITSEDEDDDGEKATGRGGSEKKQEKKDDKPREPFKKWQKPEEKKTVEPPKNHSQGPEPTKAAVTPREPESPVLGGPVTPEGAIQNVKEVFGLKQRIFDDLYKEAQGLKKFQINPWLNRNKAFIDMLPEDQRKTLNELRDHIVRGK